MALPMNAEGQVALAFWVGICVTAMSVLLLAVVLVLRQLAQRRERNHLRAAALWKQVLGDAMRAESMRGSGAHGKRLMADGAALSRAGPAVVERKFHFT